LWQSAGVLRAVGLVLAVGGLLLGCGRGSFIGRQYDDFTAYYNTFHNAQKVFEKGLKSVKQSSGPKVDRTRYISVFPEPQASSGGSSFDKAIQKSADLLREHPNSKLVDDALLLIGRSRYYQQSFVGAAQKFREVIALGAERPSPSGEAPEAEREGEARFRLAQTLLAAGRYPEAAEALRTGLEQDRNYGTWTARMHLVRGELLARQEQWDEAEQALDEGLGGEVPDEVGARAAFLLGQVRETLEDFRGARSAYQRVTEYNPKYQLEFAAQLGAIEMQGLSGDPEAALDRLSSLEREDDTKEMRGKIARVRALLYQELGQPGKAKEVLTTAIYGEDAPTGKVQGRIHYDLAALYRDAYEDFTRTAAHFDTAATNLSSGSQRQSSERADLLPRVPSDADIQAERYRRLADRSRAVARMDSLLRLGRMPPAEFQSVVEQIRTQRLKEREQEAQARRRRQQQFRGGTQGGVERDQSSQSQQNAVKTRGSDAGFLFHRDPTLVQQGRRQFKQTWGDRPLVDNWRRVNAIQGSSASTADEGAAREQEQSGARGTSESVVDVSAVPRDSASQAEMEKTRAVAQYELAKALFRDAGRPDSSEAWFLRVLEEHEDHPVTRKALYGLAQAHRAQGDTAAATAAYRRIIEEHPSTPYARRARQQLGIERAEPASPSAAGKADSAYARAYETWRGAGAPDAAVEKFLSVAETYPETSAAPRALLAAGVVYHESTQRDSSGRSHTRFERYVDSLAQSSADPPSGPEAKGDTTRADTTDRAQETPPPRKGPPSDTTDGPGVPQRAADTTAAPDPPERVDPDSVTTPDTTEATSESSARPAPDTSSYEAEELQNLPRQRIDSTAAADQDRRSRRLDSVRATPQASPSDTSARSGQKAGPNRAETEQEARPDSAQAGPERDGPSGPLEILLSHLTEQYSDTPEAKRAQKLLAHLEQQRAAPDSASSDSSASETPSETGAPSDSTMVSAHPDSTPPDSVTSSETRAQTATGPPDSTVRSPEQPADTTRSGEDMPRPMRRRDSTATPVQDSTASPETGSASPPSADSTGNR